MKAYILLEDGTIFEGQSFGSTETVVDEIVFNTGMTGYQEILTDPSYAGQIVVMTYPLIGNYGTNSEDVESSRIQASGLVVKEICEAASNFKNTKSLINYLKENNVFGISGVDTRELTKIIRSRGTMKALLTTEPLNDYLRKQLNEYKYSTNLVERVSQQDKSIISGTGKKIGLIDLGVKKGIVDHIKALGCEIHIFPWDVSSQTILDTNLDAILLSNGPGDPKDVDKTIKTAKELIGKMPIYGICLGHQILALALGGNTYKLKFGHRGSNHPVIDLKTNKVMVTAQNHGYAVYEDSLSEGIKVTHLNINDGTVEGFCAEKLNIYTVQFHPEAGPGPTDANYIFREWLAKPDSSAADHSICQDCCGRG